MVAPPIPVVVNAVKPVQADELTVIVEPPVMLTVSTLLTVAEIGVEIAAVCATLNMSLPAPPLIESKAVHRESIALNVSLPAVPVKLSIPVVSV